MRVLRFFCPLLLALVLHVSPAESQGWLVGVEAGVNISDIDAEGEDLDTSTGLRLGGVLRYDFAPTGLLGIQTGVAYSQKGAETTEDGVLVSFELDYIEVPLLLAVNIPTNSSVRPRFYAGPQVAFESSCSVIGDDADVTVDFNCGADVFEDLGLETQTTDFSVVFGGGLELGAGPGVITIDGRYDLGLTDILESEMAEDEAKNRNLYFGAGYQLQLP